MLFFKLACPAKIVGARMPLFANKSSKQAISAAQSSRHFIKARHSQFLLNKLMPCFVCKKHNVKDLVLGQDVCSPESGRKFELPCLVLASLVSALGKQNDNHDEAKFIELNSFHSW